MNFTRTQASGGGSSILAQVALTGQAANHTATTIYTPSVTGLFLVSGYCVQTGVLGVDPLPQIDLTWSDDSGTQTSGSGNITPITTQSPSSGNPGIGFSFSFPLEVTAGNPIQYSVSTGTYVTQVYSLYITVSQL